MTHGKHVLKDYREYENSSLKLNIESSRLSIKPFNL